MRLLTGVILVLIFTSLLGVLAFVASGPVQSGSLTELWVSDTPRENEVNHHPVGVGPEDDVIVAPVAAVPNSGINFTATSCSLARLAPSDGDVVWRWGVDPKDCFTHALTEPAIADVDGDGSLEVVTSTTEHVLVVIDSKTGDEEVRAPLVAYGYGRPTIANLRATPGREIVTSDIQGNIVLVSSNGTVEWRLALNRTFGTRTSVWDAPSVSDVDADGAVEIAIGTGAGPAVISASGTIEWHGETGAGDLIQVQVDSDPQFELLTTTSGEVKTIDGKYHEVEWQTEFGELLRIQDAFDGDEDGTVEFYAGLSNGTVLSIDASTGETEWSTKISTAGDAVLTAPVGADVDGSGTDELVVGTRGGTVSVLDSEDGAEIAAYQRSVPIWTFVTPADLNGDGDEELLVRYGDGRVVAPEFQT